MFPGLPAKQYGPPIHWHVYATDKDGSKRKGALTLTEAAAKAEAAIEEIEPGRTTDLEQCSQACFKRGKR